MKMIIPSRFSPTDEELITFYLLRQSTGLPIVPSSADHQHILKINLYGEKADPWLVFKHVSDSHRDLLEGDKRVIYVITRLSKIKNGKTRIARRAGCGTWSGQTPTKRIYNEYGQWVGTKRTLSFKRGDRVVRDPHDQHHWIMHEYSLDGIYSKDRCQIKNQDYVICRITRVFDQLVLSGKKRSSQIEEEVARYKKQKNAISSSSFSGVHTTQMMLAELSLSSPDSIGVSGRVDARSF